MENLYKLTWIFFAAKGITDNCDLMRAQMYIMACRKKDATIETVKESSGYKCCLYDLPDSMLTDEYIQQLIDFKD